METYIAHGESAQIFFIRKTQLEVGYPMRFANSMINDFESKEHDPVMSNYLFNDFESKPIVLIVVPLCKEVKKVSREL